MTLRHARGTPAAATAAKNLGCSSEVEQTGSTQLDQVNYQRGANNIVKVISQNKFVHVVWPLSKERFQKPRLYSELLQSKRLRSTR